jgi:glycolate oxidase FAD binding subunit
MDASARMVDAVHTAQTEGTQLCVAGAGSKRTWLPPAGGQLLVTSEHLGVVSYDPAELVITARAGTPIKELVSVLAQQHQHLAFEPPQFFSSGTVGGVVASGLSGPARPWGGSTRDAVLGVKLLNGLGECLNFGGQVMKNVAGYDVSRLAAGSWGALGALLEVSLRVQPAAQASVTLCFDMDAQAANDICRMLAQQYTALNATWWCEDQLFLRLAGTPEGVAHSAAKLGGVVVNAEQIWKRVCHHEHAFFKEMSTEMPNRRDQKLWRLVTPPAAPLPEGIESGCFALEWAGGQRWWWHDDPAAVAAYAQRVGGWAHQKGTPMRVDNVQQKYMSAIKQAFDPSNVFASPLALDAVNAN